MKFPFMMVRSGTMGRIDAKPHRDRGVKQQRTPFSRGDSTSTPSVTRWNVSSTLEGIEHAFLIRHRFAAQVKNFSYLDCENIGRKRLLEKICAFVQDSVMYDGTVRVARHVENPHIRA